MTAKFFSIVLTITIAFPAALLETGCVSTEAAAPKASGELAGTIWKPVDSPDAAIMEFTPDDRIIGCAGVNRFFGPVAYAKGKQLRLGPLAATKTAGSEADMKYEIDFFNRLEDTRGYVLDGNTLTFYNLDRQPLLKMRKPSTVVHP